MTEDLDFPHSWDGEMEALAVVDPAAIVARLPTFGNVRLSFAAEYLGDHAPAHIALPAVLPLLTHPTPVVREGALDGLYRHRGRPDVQAALRAAAAVERVPELREMFDDLIEDAGGA